MVSRGKFRSLRAALLAPFALSIAFVVAMPGAAHAVNYTWHNKHVRTNVMVYETSTATGFARKGVQATIDQAYGDYFHTIVWLGTFSATGTATANISTSTLTAARTKAKWVYRVAPNSSDTAKFIVTLTGIPSGGMRAPASESVPEVDPNPLIVQAATELGQRRGPSTSAESVNIDEYTVTRLGAEADVTYWRVGDANDATVTFGVQTGAYIATTSATQAQFADYGLPLEISADGDRTLSVILLPEDAYALEGAGLQQFAPGVWTETAPGSWDHEAVFRSSAGVTTATLFAEQK